MLIADLRGLALVGIENEEPRLLLRKHGFQPLTLELQQDRGWRELDLAHGNVAFHRRVGTPDGDQLRSQAVPAIGVLEPADLQTRRRHDRLEAFRSPGQFHLDFACPDAPGTDVADRTFHRNGGRLGLHRALEHQGRHTLRGKVVVITNPRLAVFQRTFGRGATTQKQECIGESRCIQIVCDHVVRVGAPGRALCPQGLRDGQFSQHCQQAVCDTVPHLVKLGDAVRRGVLAWLRFSPQGEQRTACLGAEAACGEIVAAPLCKVGPRIGVTDADRRAACHCDQGNAQGHQPGQGHADPAMVGGYEASR